MPNITGSVTLNGVNDSELGKIWEFKGKHENRFAFQPNAMQPMNIVNQLPHTTIYNNVVFSWSNESGLRAVHEILSFLLNKEEHAKAAGQ